MAYADQGAGGSRFASILLVVLIHVGLGAALVIGLGYEGVKRVVERVATFDVEEEVEEPEEPPPPEPDIDIPPPPPPPVAPPPPISPPSTNTSRTIQEPIVQRPQTKLCPGYNRRFDIDAACPAPPVQEKQCPGYGNRMFPVDASCPAPPQPPTPAEPRNNPGAWVTSADYPRGPLRDGVQGTVGFSVTVGTNGRVQGCSITASSGNSELDSETCKQVTRRARFRPATQNGQEVTGSYSNRVRWQIPD